MTLTRADLVAALRRGERLTPTDAEIRCDSVTSIPYRDLLDLYLAACRVHDARWTDSLGRSVAAQGGARALGRLVRDVVAWPGLYGGYRRELRRLRAQPHATAAVPADGPARAVFLRSDHWFNVVSGGSVGHLSGVIHGLRSLGVDTHVASSDFLAGVAADDRFHLCEPAYGVGRNLPSFPELTYSRKLAAFVAARWSAWQPQFVYQRYSLGNYAGVRLARDHGVPYVCEYNGSFVWMARQWNGRRLFHERLLGDVELLNLQAADLIVVVSRPMLDELVARGVDARRVLVNPNGVDPERYSPAADGTAVRTRFGLDGCVTIGFIGTFGPWHGAEVLADAFGRLLAAEPSYRARVRLLFIGDGQRRQAAEDRLRAAGALDATIFTGSIPQADGPAHLAACDILASPHVPNPDGSPFFGSPTKLFEYMATGRGIVASDLEQVGEILAHDRTAWMVPPGDADALAAGLRTLIEQPALRARLGAAAREEAVRRYTWRAHSARILEALRARRG